MTHTMTLARGPVRPVLSHTRHFMHKKTGPLQRLRRIRRHRIHSHVNIKLTLHLMHQRHTYPIATQNIRIIRRHSTILRQNIHTLPMRQTGNIHHVTSRTGATSQPQRTPRNRRHASQIRFMIISRIKRRHQNVAMVPIRRYSGLL